MKYCGRVRAAKGRSDAIGGFLARTALTCSLVVAAYLLTSQFVLSGSEPARHPMVGWDVTATGFRYPESVAYDPEANILYVSEFVSNLAAAEKSGSGRISRVSLDGTIEEERFLPGDGQTLHRPRGIWVAGDRLWVTDIDALWVFDTRTKRGRNVPLPGVLVANDPAVIGDAIYVSDSHGDQLFRIEPADFLNMEGDPVVTRVFEQADIYPNGLYPDGDGGLLMAGFNTVDRPRGIYRLAQNGAVEKISNDTGRLDGIWLTDDGLLLVTDWTSGSLGTWSAEEGYREIVSGMEGPADFSVVPRGGGPLVVVPDLRASQLRLIQLRN